MKPLVLIILALMCVVPLIHAADQKAVSTLPEDVAKFKERRDLCDHFRGEDAYDEERGKFLAESMKKYCTGTDKELTSLKTKYNNNAAILKTLADYEENIEWSN